MQSQTKTVSLALALAGLATFASAGSAAAATATWGCRGSAVELQVAANSRVAPVVAQNAPCADAVTGVPNVGQAVGVAELVTAQTAYAFTSAKPAAGFPKDQTTNAQAGVEGLELKLLAGALTIGVDAARSSVTGSCAAGVPGIRGDSVVAKLRINGQEVVADGPLGSIVNPISNSPLGAAVQVKLNEKLTDAAGLTQRAVHVIVLAAAGGAPLADVVIAESKVTSASACDPNATNNQAATTGSGSGSTNGSGAGSGNGEDGFPKVCPTGATLDRDRGLCVITASASGGQGTIVVGVPFSGPSGGRVVSLVNARRQFRSSCLNGPGPRFAIIGSNRRDRITGTNRPDRILSRGGNDVVDGGRGNDCIDGGTGADNLAGGQDRDKVLGMSGKDALNGGPGTDRLEGGSGNDTLNAAFGQDVVLGGSGIDFVNVATAGKAARVDCGTGRDKVRVNRNERFRTRGCETMFVLRD